jgi:hypothetical protein
MRRLAKRAGERSRIMQEADMVRDAAPGDDAKLAKVAGIGPMPEGAPRPERGKSRFLRMSS